jgi:hypothetical protein
MAKIIQANVERSAPRKTTKAVAVQLFAVFGAPAAWSLQLIVNFALAAEACFPNDTPLAQPDPKLAWDRPALIAINLLALAMASLAAFAAVRLWRRSKQGLTSNEDPMATAQGRSHFMAACGLLTGFGFIAAILFNTVAAVGVPQCSG